MSLIGVFKYDLKNIGNFRKKISHHIEITDEENIESKNV
jgi:hypothetical protein